MNRRTQSFNRPSISPPSPPQFRTPASGYSKSILSAIKDLPYEPSSRNMSASSSNAAKSPATPIQSPPSAEQTSIEKKTIQSDHKTSDDTTQKKEQQPHRHKTTSVLKIRVGTPQMSKIEEAEEKPQIVVKEEQKTPSENRRKQRRSISCETALPAAETKSSPQKNLQQKTQSVNVIANMAAAAAQITPRSLAGGSSILGSCLSIQSAASTATQLADAEVNAAMRKRSPSAASSITSKDEKSSTSNDAKPKIGIAIFSKALYACANGQFQEFRALAKQNPELINYQYPYCYRHSCLHIAAKAGDMQIATYLARHGANLNAKDDTWATPLHFAAKAGQLEMVQLLKNLGADHTIMDAHGKLYSAYLPQKAKSQPFVSATMKPTTSKVHQSSSSWSMQDEDTISLGSSDGGHSSRNSSSHRHHNYSFNSFRKPIGRAVRDFLGRK